MYDRAEHSDDAELEELLRDGLGDVAARAGRGAGLAARHGGRLGARIGAALLPVRHHEQELELLALSPEAAARLAGEVLAHHGQMAWAREEPGGYRIRGLIGSGALDMNPAVVDVHVRPGGQLIVHAAAKEGLIPQRTAQKAVRRVIESLRLASATYSAAPPS
jgi:hypothetical protein